MEITGRRPKLSALPLPGTGSLAPLGWAGPKRKSLEEQQPSLLPLLTITVRTAFLIPLGRLATAWGCRVTEQSPSTPPPPTVTMVPSRRTLFFLPLLSADTLQTGPPRSAGGLRPALSSPQGHPGSSCLLSVELSNFSVFVEHNSMLHGPLTSPNFFRTAWNDLLLRCYKGSLTALPKVS